MSMNQSALAKMNQAPAQHARRAALAFLALAAGLAVSPAVAQSSQPGYSAIALNMQPEGSPGRQKQEVREELRGTFDRPLRSVNRSRSANPAGDAKSSVNIVLNEVHDQDSFTLKITDGQMSAEHNGKAIPADRLRRAGDWVEVLDANGAVLHAFQLGAIPTTPVAPATGRAGKSVNVLTPASPASQAEPPVMIGLLLDYSEAENGIILQRVLDGLPGAMAGLKDGDVVIEIAGKKVESNQSLREALENKKPGDTITLKVERDGEQREISVELAKFDSQRLAKARGETDELMGFDAFRAPDAPRAFSWGGVSNDLKSSIVNSLEKALSEVKRGSAADIDKWKGEVVDSLEEALAQVESQSGELRSHLRTLGKNRNEGGGTVFFREMPGQVFEMPAVPTPPQPPTPRNQGGGQPHRSPVQSLEIERRGDQMDRLTAALERLNERLDAMEKKLDARGSDKP